MGGFLDFFNSFTPAPKPLGENKIYTEEGFKALYSASDIVKNKEAAFEYLENIKREKEGTLPSNSLFPFLDDPKFQTGLKGLMGDYFNYQENMKKDKSDSVDHSPYLVGEDRGFFQKGGEAKQYSPYSNDLDLSSLIGIESSWEKDSVSPRGAVGLGQQTNIALQDFNERNKKGLKFNKKDMFDPNKSLLVADWQFNKRIPQQLESRGLPVNNANKIMSYNSGVGQLSKLYNKYKVSTDDPEKLVGILKKSKNAKEREIGNHYIKFVKNHENAPPWLAKEYQMGGMIPTDPRGLYTNDGPVIVPSTNLTFEGIDYPVTVVPMGNGKVMEIPHKKKGGFGYYQDGGEPEERDENEPIVVQTEKGEMVAFKDGTITPVKAKKRHKQMDKSEPTDILPPESYIFSRDNAMKIPKKKADEISFGFNPLQYEENKLHDAPKEILFGEIFSKKEELPAMIAKKIQSKFPSTTRENDPFSQLSNSENNESRGPYLAALVQLSEEKKNNKMKNRYAQFGGMMGNSNMISSGFKNPYDQGITNSAYQDVVGKSDTDYKNKGIYTKQYYNQNPLRGIGNNKFFNFQDSGSPGGGSTGLPVADLAVAGFNILGDLFGFSGAAKNRKRIERNQAQSEQDIRLYERDAGQRADQSMQISSLSALAQHALNDTNVDAYDKNMMNAVRSRMINTYDDAEGDLKSIQRRTNELNQAPINSYFRNTSMMDPRTALQGANTMYATYLNGSNQNALNTQSALTKLNMDRGLGLANFDMNLSQLSTNAGNQERFNRNINNVSMAKSLGDIGVNRNMNQDTIQLNTISALMGSRGQTMNALNNLQAYQSGNINNLIEAGVPYLQQAFNRKNEKQQILEKSVLGNSGNNYDSIG